MSSKTSRWGSLLQGAVAGLEKGLDNILAEDNAAAAAAARQKQKVASATLQNGVNAEAQQSDLALPKTDLARKFSHRGTRSNHATNGEQTAKAGGGRTASSTSLQMDTTATTQDPSRTSGIEGLPLVSIDATTDTVPETGFTTTEEGSSIRIEDSATKDDQPAANFMDDADTKWDNDDARRPSHSSDRPSQTPDVLTGTSDTPRSSMDVSSVAQSIRDDPDVATRDEEIQTYLERIDALSAKLQYLAKDAAETAQHTATDTSRDSTAHQFALKDEQIALLMEEGQKLSKLELAHTTIIKKLRSKAAEDARTQAQMAQRLAKAEKLGAELSAKVSRMETAQKDSQTRMSRLLRVEEETVKLRDDNEAKRALAADLQSRLAESERELASTDGLAKALRAEKDETARLREDLGIARAQHKDYEEKSRKDISTLHQELEVAQSRVKATSAEMQTEISTLESRFELYRARAEEATSSSTTDSHAHLLRQIETLQSQYLVASENWAGIEATLQARIATLQTERDDAAAHEQDSRRKTRETGASTRRLQEQLESSADATAALERDLAEQTAWATRLQDRATEFERALREARAAFEAEKAAWAAQLAERIDAERAKWAAESPLPSLQHQQGPDSPLVRIASPTWRKGASFETVAAAAGGAAGPGGSLRRMNRLPSTHELHLGSHERPYSRRSNNTHMSKAWDALAGLTSPDLSRSTPFFHGLAAGPDTPSTRASDGGADDHDGDGAGAISPLHTVADAMSVSTVGAGPSVQLVERMGATVRRLEADKAGARDDAARTLAQRDDARREVVSLMREVEACRADKARLAGVEAELAALRQRQAGALEMLGERSERCAELEADVADLKKIYRELVESTVR